MTKQGKRLYEFGPFRLDAGERVLLRRGEPVALTPKAFDTLVALVERSGHVVEKDELMQAVWPDVYVEEGGLARNISVLRKVLGEGEGGGGRGYIETVPKRGYRFVGEVSEVMTAGAAELVLERHTRSRLLIEEEEEGSAEVERTLDKALLAHGRQAVAEAAHTGAPEVRPLTSNRKDLARRGTSWKRGRILAVTGAAFILVLATALILYKHLDQGRSELHPAVTSQKLGVTKLTTNSRVMTAAISPDGKYVVHSQEDGGRQSLWLKQIATSSEVQIVAPAEVKYVGGTFTPDGSYLYYVMEEKNSSSGVYQIPAVGGTPRRILQGIDAAVTLSPDGRRFAFVRLDRGQSETSLWAANADGSAEQKLATRTGSEWFDNGVGVGPAWSPDGSVIACSVGGVDAGGEYHTVVGVKVESGEQAAITPQRWKEGGQVAWRTAGDGLVMIGDEQVWQLSYPGGEARKITNDANRYIGVGITADSDAVVTVQIENESSIWVAPSGDVQRAQPVTSGAYEGYRGLSWAPDGTIVYTSKAGGHWDIWSMAADGTGRKQLTADAGSNDAPSVSPDGRYVVFVSTRTGTRHIWRINIDGSDPRQLTQGSAEGWPECSPDGRWVAYVAFAASAPQTLWKVSIEGGEPVPVTGILSHLPAFSPDGKLIAFRNDDGPGASAKISVMSFETGRLVKTLDIRPTTILSGDYKALRWTPDGGGLAYIDARTGVANIWIRPLDGGPERQLTAFKSEQVFRFNWSPDGKYLAVTRGAMMKDVILISVLE